MKSELVLNCAVEQRLARQAHNLEVVGSIPTGATYFENLRMKFPPQSQGGFFMRGLRSLVTLFEPGVMSSGVPWHPTMVAAD